MSETDEQRALARFATVLASLSREDVLTVRLCEAGRRMLQGDGASMTLDYTGSGRLMVHSTDATSASLDDLQDVVGEGPSFDAARTGEVVVARLGGDSEDRWTLLSQRLLDLGLDFSGTMIAIPLRAEVTILGVLSVHRLGPERDEDLISARFLGTTVGTALLQDPQATRAGHVFEDVWSSRAEIHQATGMIVAQVGVRSEDALALLRGQAFARNAKLLDVARDIIARRVDFRDFTIEGD